MWNAYEVLEAYREVLKKRTADLEAALKMGLENTYKPLGLSARAARIQYKQAKRQMWIIHDEEKRNNAS